MGSCSCGATGFGAAGNLDDEGMLLLHLLELKHQLNSRCNGRHDSLDWDKDGVRQIRTSGCYLFIKPRELEEVQ